MYLLLWGAFLSCLSSITAPITKYLVELSSSVTEFEQDLRKQLKELQKELKGISMMDEFAEYARTERKINKVNEKLEACNSARNVQSGKAKWAFTLTIHSITGLLTFLSVWSSWGEPVVILPAEWVWPVGWFLSSPGVGVSGGVSLPAWMALCRTSYKMLPSFPSVFSAPNYSQLPLD
ncbi:tail-anchored protein insertion receptor WRB-like [Eurytemora carolleeae]|uniref:tail-anchored protein insertion receptor WRB-like n=1 Tax=Eurytemora carolleeae TaxID=1294199 RepID=UPI000C78B198|nr:tail-anchored protein insertion receptor WRB-like [Eurytemora carolleeae]XP_023336971.1 tail-anchored protein insertion receptor WRB-like [Eurytemora carolleeae]XP_023336972.1 tail-anchored protein insertion receptor WRB-like [Eurytemora carolleeae]XP_023336973.1 tail-anchored protein insertion receptor WRB-like [Eurytemora carolleeae]XP_023336974.1 tail-anchored protein insertion receptor WRB-like [Eurytemora carolleeae]XP_023336975.1 tail-anchored protein insertion receptor WRB-like [Eury|eukprot:XP_023336970.1 tail-anchored protein insertion receptor WRB-like [Eurytemora affinis]